ncbi:MAG TPA: hypothetical protein VMN35_08765 [Gaiellaceae bacterium]|nr:hypothetical protein [Gaiellaceae bacterium]
MRSDVPLRRRVVSKGAFGISLAGLLVLVLAGSPAAQTAGNLPGGTSISVDVTAPSDGAVKVFPPGNIELEGTAEVGAGVPVANTGFLYVIDGSGSTVDPAGGDCGPDQNPGDPEGAEDEVIDCEIAAVITLNDAVTTLGTVGEVAMTLFAGAPVTADATPAGGDDPIIAPDADANTNGIPDVNEVLGSIRIAEFLGEDSGFWEFSVKPTPDIALTDFAEAADAACTLAGSLTSVTRQVIFLSDGAANGGADVTTVLPCGDVVFQTFAVGSGSSCAGDPNGLGSLQEIADLTGGSCFEINDPTDLPDEIVPAVVQSQLVSLELSVDGGAFVDISASSSVALPAAGPVSVTFDHLVPGLAPGTHELCVRANGTDGGGAGSVTECIEVVVATIDLAPAAAINELGTPGQTHTVTATVAAGADGGVPGVTVEFDVISGPNAGASGSGVTDGDGEVEFTYAATQGSAGLGTDTIQACFSDEQDDTVCDTAAKEWRDTTPPEAACSPGPNPSGKKVPPASNEDGFFVLTATDAVDPDPEIFIHDSGSSFVAGPFPSGTTIKLVQAPGATPSVSPGPGAVDWVIRLKGDAQLFAVDDSGNVAGPIMCLVPPPPK